MKSVSENLKISFFTLALFVTMAGAAQSNLKVYNPSDYGAKGDGKTLNTDAIQKAIDDCHDNGGGKVYLYKGIYISGTVILKSNVTFFIESGTILRASIDLEDFPIMPSKYPSYEGDYETNKMLIYAEDARNISIAGKGVIDGNGDFWIDGPYDFPSFSVRPRIIHFRGCKNILIRDITLYNSASWVQSYQTCKNIVIDGITVDSRENKDIEKPRYADAPGRNNDGLDLVDCEQVRISNSYINSGDDAICLKSFSPDEACRDITITNCVVSSNASAIKIGTETAGAFQDITVQNCAVFDTRGYAIQIMTADGAQIERISVSGIVARNIKGAVIGLRLGHRHRTYRKDITLNNAYLKDIIIENIQATTISSGYGCFISGIPNQPVENVVLRNINLKFEGEDIIDNSYRMLSYRQEDPAFTGLTGYGFFIRHAKSIIIDDIQMNYNKKDKLLPILCDDVERLEIKKLKTSQSLHVPDLIRLADVKDVVISESRPVSPVPVFLSVYGKSDSIILLNNVLKNAGQNIVLNDGIEESIIDEFGTIE